MVYIDENGTVLESINLNLGYLEDAEWIDHPEVPQTGHYEYEELETGGRLQTYVVDTHKQSAWREVTKQRYIPYTEAELEIRAKSDYTSRLQALEAANVAQNDTNELLTAQIQAVSDRGDFVEDCLAEMAQVVYE